MTKNFIKKIKGVHPSSRILSTFISVQSTDLVIATLRLIKQKKNDNNFTANIIINN